MIRSLQLDNLQKFAHHMWVDNCFFELPSSEEISTYNKMECSALNSKLLEELGWSGTWDLYNGIAESIDRIRERI